MQGVRVAVPLARGHAEVCRKSCRFHAVSQKLAQQAPQRGVLFFDLHREVEREGRRFALRILVEIIRHAVRGLALLVHGERVVCKIPQIEQGQAGEHLRVVRLVEPGVKVRGVLLDLLKLHGGQLRLIRRLLR